MFSVTCRQSDVRNGVLQFGGVEANTVSYVTSEKVNDIWLHNKVAMLNLCEFIRDCSRPLVYFVHGFNMSFDDALDMGWGLSQKYDVDVICYSWASDGEISGYFDDEKKAIDGVVAFSQSINLFACKRANLFIHSMGNRLFKHFIQEDPINGLRCHLFNNIALVEADVPSANHVLWCDEIKAQGKLYVTINPFDYALGCSSAIHQGERLGDCQTGLNAKEAVYLDLTEVVGVSHDPFDSNDERVTSMFRRLLQGQIAEAGMEKISRNVYAVTQVSSCVII